MRPVDKDKLIEVCRPVVEGLGYDLIDLEYKTEMGANVLRVFVDHLSGQGNVSLDDCTAVSRALSPTLDVEDVISAAYSLEVSSPGLNRPLTRESDFRRFVGKRAKIRTRHPIGETRRNFAGTLVAVEAGRVRIDVGDQTFDVPVDDVEKANLVYEF